MKKMKILVFVGMLGLLHVAVAQSADDYRGGWRTDKGEAHTYEFSIRGSKVRGIYCTYCADATTLAFVDGTFGPDGINFVVTPSISSISHVISLHVYQVPFASTPVEKLF